MVPEKIDALITSLTTDYKKADVDKKERAALDYALKLTKAPGDIMQTDVETLRCHGFNDRAIHDICAVTARLLSIRYRKRPATKQVVP